ncbi:MAG: ABC transporter permease [Candidatus Limiplasma sp.]|nr:ABC transporter permease [Candidatus Limiplasma sp.]
MKGTLEKLKSTNTIVWFLLGYVLICVSFIPHFSTAYNIRNILRQVCVLLIVGCGQTYAVLNGGVDFSATSVIALSGVVGASLMSASRGILPSAWYTVPVALGAMLLIGLVFGAINGLSIVTFKMPSFIVTMATQMIGSGLALLYTQSQTIGGLPDSFTAFGTGSVGVFPYTFFFALLVALVTHFILSRTKLGRQIYAVGNNPKTALISGIPVKKTIFKLYLISGLCSACGGIVMIAQMESAAPSFASNMFIDFMSAIIIGGASPLGGSGKISGTLLGAFLIILINISMNLLGVDWYVISIIKGLIVLLAAAADLAKKVRVRA